MKSLFPFVASSGSPRWLFVDMNAFYASVEQQECAAYRNRPVIVVPVLAEHTCAIAASYEAKARGIKTGTSVALARATAPDLHIVEARPQLYLDYHARLVAILNQHFATIKVLSVDEMACRIPALLYKTARDETRLAERLKQQVYSELGPHLRCSIGIGPNVFLAKVASDCQKPDGLTVFDDTNLPEALFALKLTDLPGIGSAMKRRLAEHGITSVESLWNASPLDLRRAWHSVVGERWHYMLRGDQQADYQPMQSSPTRKSVGHSNVLAPEHRRLDAAKNVLMHLFVKALKRLRAYNQLASGVQITVKYRKVAANSACLWTRGSRKHLHANDEITWLRAVRPLLDAIPDLFPAAELTYVGIVFSGLISCCDRNLSLFEDTTEQQHLSQVLDDLNRRYPHAVERLSLHGIHETVPDRIAFGAPDSRPPDPLLH